MLRVRMPVRVRVRIQSVLSTLLARGVRVFVRASVCACVFVRACNSRACWLGLCPSRASPEHIT